MKNISNIAPNIHSKYWLIVFNIFFMIMISSCSPSSDNSIVFTPQNTLGGKIFVYGTHVVGGELIVYANGTDNSGNPLTIADLQAATVLLDGVDVASGVTITDVSPGEQILSVSLLTDYSGSMADNELNDVATIYKLVLDNLPRIFEAQVINFSDTYHEQLVWTEAVTGLAAIKTAVELDATIIRNATALYDAIGYALLAGPTPPADVTTQGNGLIERCRPAHLLIVFSDGKENNSITYTDKSMLIDLIETSKTVPIMLGTSTADQAELEALAGSNGAVVQVFDTDGILAEVNSWAASLSNMVKFTLTASTGFAGKTVNIELGSQAVTVVRPTDSLCEIPIPL